MDWCEVDEADVIECLKIQPQVCGDEIVGRECALQVWKEWTRNRAFKSAVVETDGAPPSRRKVAFGSSVFVTTEFADQELRCPRPGLNSRLIASVVAGESVVCSEESLSNASTGNALDLVVLSCNCMYEAMSPEEASEAEMMLPMAFVEAHVGYRLNRILLEAVCERQQRVHESSGVWRVVKAFPERKRALMLLAREEALSVSGSIAMPLFQYREPVLHLRDTEKELLAEAMNGDTDNELAARMNLSLPAVKKRWASLFDRIADVRPELLPNTENRDCQESRGPQKRHRILAYVRAHPEEIRPFSRRTRWQA